MWKKLPVLLQNLELFLTRYLHPTQAMVRSLVICGTSSSSSESKLSSRVMAISLSRFSFRRASAAMDACHLGLIYFPYKKIPNIFPHIFRNHFSLIYSIIPILILHSSQGICDPLYSRSLFMFVSMKMLGHTHPIFKMPFLCNIR